MNHGLTLIVSFSSFVQTSSREFGEVGLGTYTWGIKGFHKNWSGSLAKRRLCLGPTGVINCTSLPASSFWVSLFPGTCGYNNYFKVFTVQSRRQTDNRRFSIKCVSTLNGNFKNLQLSLRLKLSSHWMFSLGHDCKWHSLYLISINSISLILQWLFHKLENRISDI